MLTERQLEEVVRILGSRLVAYITGQPSTSEIHAWLGKAEIDEGSLKRLEILEKMTTKLGQAGDGNRMLQAWFLGMNPTLNNVSPARLIREQPADQLDNPAFHSDLMAAVSNFLVT